MVFSVRAQLVSFVLDRARLLLRTDQSKDIEILLLRRQLAILQRTQARPPQLTRFEQLVLAVLANRLRQVREHEMVAGGSACRMNRVVLVG